MLVLDVVVLDEVVVAACSVVVGGSDVVAADDPACGVLTEELSESLQLAASARTITGSALQRLMFCSVPVLRFQPREYPRAGPSDLSSAEGGRQDRQSAAPL